MAARVIQGNVFDVLPTLPRGSVDAVCTSPPYWQLRSYLPKGHALKPLELGSEPTPAAYVENMVKVLRLVRDVMADHAVAFVNVGDTYASGVVGRNDGGRPATFVPRGVGGSLVPSGTSRPQRATRVELDSGTSPGSLCLIPQRLAVALQDDGWIVRSMIVWHKPACMPASLAGWMWKRCRVKVKAGDYGEQVRPRSGANRNGHVGGDQGTAQWADCPGCPKCTPHGGYVLRRGSWRPTSSWEPVLMLAKRQGYYSDGEAVKQPATMTPQRRLTPGTIGTNGNNDRRDLDRERLARTDPLQDAATANLRDVWRADLEKLTKEELIALVTDSPDLTDCWTIASEPLHEAHYAAFPTELVHRCLKAATSARGYCPACGAPWARVVEMPAGIRRPTLLDCPDRKDPYRPNGQDLAAREPSRTLGWRQSCACPPAEPRPGLVLDCFAGSGRVGIECLRLGLDFVGCELNPEYSAMANRLFREESPLFAGVE